MRKWARASGVKVGTGFAQNSSSLRGRRPEAKLARDQPIQRADALDCFSAATKSQFILSGCCKQPAEGPLAMTA